jgi:hypothetical protein
MTGLRPAITSLSRHSLLGHPYMETRDEPFHTFVLRQIRDPLTARRGRPGSVSTRWGPLPMVIHSVTGWVFRGARPGGHGAGSPVVTFPGSRGSTCWLEVHRSRSGSSAWAFCTTHPLIESRQYIVEGRGNLSCLRGYSVLDDRFQGIPRPPCERDSRFRVLLQWSDEAHVVWSGDDFDARAPGDKAADLKKPRCWGPQSYHRRRRLDSTMTEASTGAHSPSSRHYHGWDRGR